MLTRSLGEKKVRNQLLPAPSRPKKDLPKSRLAKLVEYGKYCDARCFAVKFDYGITLQHYYYSSSLYFSQNESIVLYSHSLPLPMVSHYYTH